VKKRRGKGGRAATYRKQVTSLWQGKVGGPKNEREKDRGPRGGGLRGFSLGGVGNCRVRGGKSPNTGTRTETDQKGKESQQEPEGRITNFKPHPKMVKTGVECKKGVNKRKGCCGGS